MVLIFNPGKAAMAMRIDDLQRELATALPGLPIEVPPTDFAGYARDLARSSQEQAGQAAYGVCHGPAGLLYVELENGLRLVEGRKVAAFTNDEEVAAGKDKVIPFFLADRLEEQGATHVRS